MLLKHVSMISWISSCYYNTIMKYVVISPFMNEVRALEVISHFSEWSRNIFGYSPITNWSWSICGFIPLYHCIASCAFALLHGMRSYVANLWLRPYRYSIVRCPRRGTMQLYTLLCVKAVDMAFAFICILGSSCHLYDIVDMKTSLHLWSHWKFIFDIVGIAIIRYVMRSLFLTRIVIHSWEWVVILAAMVVTRGLLCYVVDAIR
jgi:hypothetical protein